jgi:hypothetical protein
VGTIRKDIAAGLLIAALSVVALSACVPASNNLPMISPADVASGKALPQGILPNGIMYEPWFG